MKMSRAILLLFLSLPAAWPQDDHVTLARAHHDILSLNEIRSEHIPLVIDDLEVIGAREPFGALEQIDAHRNG